VQKFVNASVKGWQWAVDHPSEATAIVTQVDPHLDRDHQARMLNAAIPLIKPSADTRIGEIDAKTWAAMYKVLVDAHVIARPLDVRDAYTTGFIDHFLSGRQ
jgi:NitT/TauT family transport system substrate-binding protein